VVGIRGEGWLGPTREENERGKEREKKRKEMRGESVPS
jgi:hypothetical protein